MNSDSGHDNGHFPAYSANFAEFAVTLNNHWVALFTRNLVTGAGEIFEGTLIGDDSKGSLVSLGGRVGRSESRMVARSEIIAWAPNVSSKNREEATRSAEAVRSE